MTIREFINTIDNLDWEERKSAIIAMSRIFTPTSLQTLLTFQIEYAENPELDWDFFSSHMNEEIKKCIYIELSDEGIDLRKKLNMPLLTLETEI
jgi:hypothetical protein